MMTKNWHKEKINKQKDTQNDHDHMQLKHNEIEMMTKFMQNDYT